MKKHRANHEVRPTGYEIVEFLDAPGIGDATVIETCPVALTQSDGTVEVGHSGEVAEPKAIVLDAALLCRARPKEARP